MNVLPELIVSINSVTSGATEYSVIGLCYPMHRHD